MYKIDLNSDVAESFGDYRIGNDDEIFKHITTANVACGWHAGDPMIMDHAMQLAKKYNVQVGAHPGCPDMMGFGRRKMLLSPEEVKNYTKYQIGALKAFTDSYGIKLTHMVPHGSWGGLSQTDYEFCEALCQGVYEVDKTIRIHYIAGTLLGEVAKSKGMDTASIIFADRAYMEDGKLAPRSMENSVIKDEELAISRCVKMIKEKKVIAITGKEIDMHGDTLCVHGDGEKALLFLLKIRERFEQEGIKITSL